MMRISTKSGRVIAALTAVVFLMTSFLTVFADVTVSETSAASVKAGETATITVSNAVGSEQTTVLVYLGTPEDDNIIYIDQTAASEGTATFTFKVPTTAKPGTYTILAGSESTTTAGDSTIVVNAADSEGPVLPTLTSIAVADDAKVEYTVGDEFVAPAVTATYSDGSTKTVTATFEGYDMATAGTQTVTVTYEGVTTTYEITVTAPVVAPTLVSIAVSNAKTEYTVGDEFVAPEVIATYSDDSTATVTATFEGYDMATAGTQTVTVKYEGVTTTYEITVAEAVVEPVANENVRNGKYGVSVTVADSYGFHGNYSVEVEPNTDYILAAWSKGNGSVLIRPRQNDGWGGGDNLGDLNLEGGSAWKQSAKIVTTKEGATKVVLSLVTNTYGGAGTKYIDDIYFAKASDPTVNLIANPGFEGESGWKYSSAAVRLESGVEMVNNPVYFAVTEAKTEYFVGDEFVAPTVVAYNADGTTAAVEGATFSGYDLATEGTQRVTVTTENGKTYYYITVAPVPVNPDATLVSIAVSDAKTEYTVGDEFVAPTVIATYSDDSTTEVVAEFTGYDMAAEGTQTVTVTYEGVTTTYEITVAPAPVVEDWAVSATFDADDTVAFAGNAFDIRNPGQTSEDTVKKTGANGQGLDGTNAVGFNYARTGQWGGVQTATTPATVDWSKVKRVSFYARIIPSDANNEIKFTMRINGPKKNCSFTANTGWQYFEYDLSDVDFSSVPTSKQIQWTQDKNGAGKLVVDNLTFSNYQVAAISPLMQGITVSGAKTEYTVGDEFVAPETITAAYSDETTADIKADAVISGYDMATEGTQTVSVAYKGFTAKYDITVAAAVEPPVDPEPTLVSIAVADDAKVEYTVGDEFVAPVVTATYSDDSTAVVTAEFTGYDMATAGTQTVTVTYEGVTTTYEITVAAVVEPPVDPEPTLVSIAVADDAKVEYTVGDEFVAPVVTATYSDDSTAVVTAEFTGYDMATAGTQTVTVTYEGVTTTYEITVAAVVEPPVQPDIEVLASYLDLDFEDAAYAQKDDGTGVMVDDYWNMVTTNKATGNQVTVKFNGTNTGNRYQVYDDNGNKFIATKGRKTQIAYEFAPEAPVADSANFVYVEAKIKRTSYNLDDPVSLAVTDDSNKTIFRLDYKQNVAPVLVADATYETVTYPVNGDWTYVRAIIDFSKSTFELYQGASLAEMVPMVEGTTSLGFNSAAANVAKIGNISTGDKKGSLGFDDIKIYTVAPPAKVVESISVSDAKTAYYVGDEFVAPVVTAKYTEAMYADEVVTGATFTGYDMSVAGTQTVTVTYGEATTTFDITVEPVVLDSIAVAADAKTVYFVGDEFVAPEVTATYNNGSTAVVEAAFTGYDMAAEGTQTVTVTYEDKTITYEITVTVATLESIAVAADAKVEYTVGDEFVAPEVTATYTDGTTAVVAAQFTGYDMATAGTQTVTVTFEGVTTTYEITVAEAAPSLPTFTASVDVTRDLDYAGDAEPAEVYYVKSFVLSEGNGTYDVKIGDRQLYWSAERKCYVGVVDVANYDAEAKTLYNVSIVTVDKATSLKYGDLDGNNKINTTDFSALKNYMELGVIPVIRPAADVTADGRINNTDLKGLATYMETEEPFFPEN